MSERRQQDSTPRGDRDGAAGREQVGRSSRSPVGLGFAVNGGPHGLETLRLGDWCPMMWGIGFAEPPASRKVCVEDSCSLLSLLGAVLRV